MSTLTSKLATKAAQARAYAMQAKQPIQQALPAKPVDTPRVIGGHDPSYMRDPITYRAKRAANPVHSDHGHYIPKQEAFDRTFYVEYVNMHAETLAIRAGNRQPWSCAAWADGYPTPDNVRRWLRRNAVASVNGAQLHRMEAAIYRIDTGDCVLHINA